MSQKKIKRTPAHALAKAKAAGRVRLDNREMSAAELAQVKKMVETMLTNETTVTITDSSKEAPNYDEDWVPIRMDNVVVVKRGTELGKSTVDLQFVDTMGHKYVAMMSGAIIGALAKAVEGSEVNAKVEPVDPNSN